MCGICGILGFADNEKESATEAMEASVALLRHRGPDASGVWLGESVALGHTRLSIIDLTACGNQPMHDPSGRWTLIYNGEVYNYVELREQLRDRGYTFRGHSDTEVVLTALMEWGESALDRFNGMWALALWDAARHELFLSRDRVGKKPLYFAFLPDGKFAFASEVSPILSMGSHKPGVNHQAAFDFLTQGTYGHLGTETFFDGIQQLPAAHWAKVRPDGRFVCQRYWDLPDVKRSDRIPYDGGFQRQFRDLFTDAVRLRLRSDVPVGATLSGGLDSSAIALVTNSITEGAPLHLFTRLFPNTRYDESRYFQAVCDRLQAPLVHKVETDLANWSGTLLEVLHHQEEPFGDTSILAHYTLMRAARAEGVPVILSGQGGDELLLGYPSMVTTYLGSRLARGDFVALRDAKLWAKASGSPALRVIRNVLGAALPIESRDRVRQLFVRRLANRVTPELAQRVSLRRFEFNERDDFDSYLRQVFTRFSIPHLTQYDDRNAMAFGVEGRMPFLDVRLVELMFSVQYDALFANGFTKRVLRDSFRDLLPERVRMRPDKIGFFTPMATWLRSHSGWIRDFMTTERIRAAGLLKPGRYHRVLSSLEQGNNNAQVEVWRGFIVHLWIDKVLNALPAPDNRRPNHLGA